MRIELKPELGEDLRQKSESEMKMEQKPGLDQEIELESLLK